MIIVMKLNSTKEQIEKVVNRVEELGFKAHISAGKERTIIGIIGDERTLPIQTIEFIEGVERIVPILQPFKLASRDFQPDNTIIKIGNVEIGSNEIVIIAGPCAVESREQLLNTAMAVKKSGAMLLRGGAFKPRSSPYSFQGLGEAGLELLAEAREKTGLPFVTEVISPSDVELVSKYSDVLQIGARNMQNFALLHEVGKSNHPVLLKRGLMSTIQELLMSAEYILSNGNYKVILCERGIRTFETASRNTLDINAVPIIKKLSHLPVIVDPSHATGYKYLVPAASKASIACGADGLIIEVHSEPEKALCDGSQSLNPADFDELMPEVRRVAEAVGRKIL